MRLALLGVRGSTPAPGEQFTRYGGHTSCLAVLSDADPVPHLVLDAGTGLRELPTLLHGKAFQGAIVLTHLHWDHVQGLPFCSSIDREDARVDLFVPNQGVDAVGVRDGGADHDGVAHDLLAGIMSPPYFPIDPDGLIGRWRVLAAAPSRWAVGQGTGSGDAVVTVAEIAHKGGTTLGVKVEADGSTAAYLPDHLIQAAPPWLVDSATTLARGVDVLLHDGQFTDDERDIAAAYGHATIGDAMRFADRCGVGALVLTHHAPGRTDAEMDALAAAIRCTPGGRPVRFARQGEVISVVRSGDPEGVRGPEPMRAKHR